MNELIKWQIQFFKNHWKSKFKMPEFEKEEELGREKAMALKETSKFLCKFKNFYVSLKKS